jgi:hypothetical protein
MTIFRAISRYLLLAFLSWLIVRCANPVSPEGGPKDVKPPVVVASFPENLCLNFKNDEIKITFNEFIQLKDQYNQVLISPPLSKSPDLRIKGKSLVIAFADTLLPNTTYSIDFGNAIADLNEYNVLKNFRFVFSTGSFLDSLQVKERVISAFDDTPQKDIQVLLYAKHSDTLALDSMPLHVKPSYLVKSDENGMFHFENVRSGDLLLFAIKDQNGNGFFDLPNEKIAFMDTLVSGIWMQEEKKVATAIDTLTIKQDTLHRDTISVTSSMVPLYTLRLFEETDSVQKVLKSTIVQKDEIGVFFRFPTSDVQFRQLRNSVPDDWAVKELTPARDTAFLWMKSNTYDSLFIEVADNHKVIDTIRLSLLEKGSKKKKEKKGEEQVQRIFLASNFRVGKLNQYRRNPQVTFSYPLRRADLSRILLISDKDTTHPLCRFSDSTHRILTFPNKWKEEHKYRFIFPDSIFYSLNGLTNDSVFMSFSTSSQRDFGSITINLTAIDTSQGNILQLLSEKENVIEQRIIRQTGKVHFENLPPGKYKFKCIFDRNRNGRWDTGCYRKKLQPEEVTYFPKVIELRSNWDIEEDWNTERKDY